MIQIKRLFERAHCCDFDERMDVQFIAVMCDSPLPLTWKTLRQIKWRLGRLARGVLSAAWRPSQRDFECLFGTELELSLAAQA